MLSVTGTVSITINDAEQKRITIKYLKSLLPMGYDDLGIRDGTLYGVYHGRSHRRDTEQDIRTATAQDILFLSTLKELL